uniref:Uncharacterized protein n=1 Tax=Arundo donax TaxID=35708 RepID=A0A0A8Y774_ARUDO
MNASDSHAQQLGTVRVILTCHLLLRQLRPNEDADAQADA